MESNPMSVLTRWLCVLSLILLLWSPVSAGDQKRKLIVDDRERSYLVHYPTGHDTSRPTPVVLVLHGGGLNAVLMQHLTQFDALADREGFVTVYPNGTGSNRFFLSFNTGGVLPPEDEGLPDDVAFIRAMLDDLAATTAIDSRRVFACGYSNGGMMCYRLAAELSDRIAAIGSVAGTQAIPFPLPPRPVPVIHFHGSQDQIVLPGGPAPPLPPFLTYLSLDETIAIWSAHNGCAAEPEVKSLPNIARDATTVVRTTYAPCAAETEVVLHWIVGGGHTWPGAATPPNPITGRTSQDISANELLWEFFQRHPRPE
jgi:polyhydroxybutyrate depolymerase